MKNRELLELIVTDSIPWRKIEQNKSSELCTSFAEVMHMVHHNNSISNF
jgi:phosphoribosylpyrophosphate synthetase